MIRVKKRYKILAALFALSFWGAAFPHYFFTSDCVKLFDKEGNEITGEARKNKNLYAEIGAATSEQIEIKLGILEWAKR